MERVEKVRENRLRRKAERQGLKLIKSRRRDEDALDFGLYTLIDPDTGGTLHPHHALGSPYALDLDDVEVYLTGDDEDGGGT